MFQATYAVFLIITILYNKTGSCLDSFYGVKTNEYPKTSCHKFAKIKTAGRCLGACRITMDRIIMISHDKTTQTCMCCSDITGSDIADPNWKSFVPRTLPCANDYVTYYLMPYQICLKYFPGPVSYSTAQANCHAQDADLIKIDSQEKYDIFKDYHEPIAKKDAIEVWVQGENVGGQWQFDDGTPIPLICPIKLQGNEDEVHMRAKSSNSFNCSNAANALLCNYSCEYHFLSSFNN